MLCQICLNPARQVFQQAQSFNIRRKYFCASCQESFSTSERHVEPPQDFFPGTSRKIGLNQMLILRQLISGPLKLWQIRARHKEWCGRTGKRFNRNSFYRGVKSLQKRKLLDVDRYGNAQLNPIIGHSI